MARVGERPMDRPKQTIRKFYKEARVEDRNGALHLLLDEREAKTPTKKPIVAATKAMAEVMVAEWTAQEDEIDFTTMPISQRQMVLLDRQEGDEARWQQTVLDYAQSDLLCYRAEEPQELVDRQEAEWGPVLRWAEQKLGHKFSVTSGIISVPQSEGLLAAAQTALQAKSIEDLFALCSLTQLTGSAIIGLALIEGELEADKAFALSRLDETYQAEKWGADSEAVEREAKLKTSFDDDLTWLGLSR